jgi:hypothetical protein
MDHIEEISKRMLIGSIIMEWECNNIHMLVVITIHIIQVAITEVAMDTMVRITVKQFKFQKVKRTNFYTILQQTLKCEQDHQL